MTQLADSDRTHQLQKLMQRVGISSFKQLSQQAGVSDRPVMRLRRGEISQMRLETLLKFSRVLQVSVNELLITFGNITLPVEEVSQTSIKQEYQRLQTQMEQQRELLIEEFQQSSLQILESWLLQWPTAAKAARENPQFEATKLLPLVRPVEKLMQEWGVEAIAPIGAEIAYHPQWHQLMDGTAQAGDLVKVRYAGYRQGDKLLFRAKVSPISG